MRHSTCNDLHTLDEFIGNYFVDPWLQCFPRHGAEFSYLWPIAAAMGIPHLEFDSSCYQKNPKVDLIAAAIKQIQKRN